MIKKLAHGALVLAAVLLLGYFPSQAEDVLPVNLEKMTVQAGRIFEGTCVENHVEQDPKTGMVQTVTTFEVHDSLKGNGSKQIQIKQYGGIFPNGDGLLVAAMPRYAEGERVMLFLRPESQKGLTSPVGLGQGKFRLLPKKDGVGYRALNSLENQNVFRGIQADRLLRRDAKGQIQPEDRALLRALKSGSEGADSVDFKALVKRIMEIPPDSPANGKGGRVKINGEAAR